MIGTSEHHLTDHFHSGGAFERKVLIEEGGGGVKLQTIKTSELTGGRGMESGVKVHSLYYNVFSRGGLEMFFERVVLAF